MIFVTVGTHEQQFNRLIEEVDRLKGEGVIEDDVIMQTGFSTYEPKYCKWNQLIPYSKMQEYIKNARIVITHGGPASFIAPIQIGKIPIVVPRQKQFDEHVNNHQVEFCKRVENEMDNIILVEDCKKLKKAIIEYDIRCERKNKDLKSCNLNFNKRLEAIVTELGVKQ